MMGIRQAGAARPSRLSPRRLPSRPGPPRLSRLPRPGCQGDLADQQPWVAALGAPGPRHPELAGCRDCGGQSDAVGLLRLAAPGAWEMSDAVVRLTPAVLVGAVHRRPDLCHRSRPVSLAQV